MGIENIKYVPTLAIRASEMNGLEFLPGVTKDNMTPCILLAPWANSHAIDRSITRIERTFPNRPYFLTPDPNYQITNDQSIAQQEFTALLDPKGEYNNWLNFVNKYKNVMPCIQYKNQTEEQIRKQINNVQQMTRTYALRLVKDALPDNLDEVVNAFSVEGFADFVIILEGGWTDDPLSLSAWFSGVISNSLSEIDASVPIICSCTSIPKEFAQFTASRPSVFGFTNRQLVDQISRNNNRAKIVYGDWGSTRPREIGGFAKRPRDRIDYPTDDAWYIARNPVDEWDFRNAALAITNSRIWNGNLGIWGEEQIQHTTTHKDLGINTPQKNVAARVNIHLHIQAFYGQAKPDPIVFDDDWQD